MNNGRIFLASTGEALLRAEWVDSVWRVVKVLDHIQVNCIVSDPVDTTNVYVGSQRKGILISGETGKTWNPLGLETHPIKSIVIDPFNPKKIYAGCKPVSLFLSNDGGETWQELPGLRIRKKWWWFSPAEPPDWSPYIQALTISPTTPNVIFAGIELGGVLRSTDGGETWSDHKKGAHRDCHSLKFHPIHGDWIYQGGGGGPAVSRDGGITWRKMKAGLGTKYGWMVAADVKQPEIWYLSASSIPNPLLGEFTPPAHHDGQAKAHIYRSVGGAAWEQLSGGLPQPLDYMAYALIADPKLPGCLYAGLANGDVWFTADYGDSWKQMPLNFGKIQRTLHMIS